MDPYKLLGINRINGASLRRRAVFAVSPPSNLPLTGDAAAPPPQSSLSKDVPLDPRLGTWLRIFLPSGGEGGDDHRRSLPLVVDFHGGGFVLFSAASTPFHKMCSRYRLAPEHRLPAAYDDAVAAILWLRNQAAAAISPPRPGSEEADPWLARADFSRCFLSGTSAGGNIVYHAARRLLVEDPQNLSPLQIRGLILNQPFFGGVERTPSEKAMIEDKILPLPITDLLTPSETSTDLPINDLLWELALPEGTDRDHPFCNPLLRHHHWRRRRWLPRCLIRCYLGDPLIDRLRALAAELRHQAAKLVTLFDADGFHGIELYDPSKFQSLIDDLKLFISSSSSSSPPPPAAAAAAAAEEEEKEHASGGRF
ncbi:unnamed protein product [Spirodela intermedia]|uniref:Alpha/beta hydrolase fold-3 domain-containing protein n=1 Tax=Spirodela intermedia TaxID=51605 RepID=A0A7I8IHJ6_SPIIN|nr:unnamed protein product [Spirodela intermedia]CAA6657196.1 unnamed protein product [Spirodela intermedia]